MHLGIFKAFTSFLRLPNQLRMTSSTASTMSSLLPPALASATNIRLLPPNPHTVLPAPAAILFIPGNLVGSAIAETLGPAERWAREGLWVLEVAMDENGRDLPAQDEGSERVRGWNEILKEGRDALSQVDGVDGHKAVGIIGQSRQVWVPGLSCMPSTLGQTLTVLSTPLGTSSALAARTSPAPPVDPLAVASAVLGTRPPWVDLAHPVPPDADPVASPPTPLGRTRL